MLYTKLTTGIFEGCVIFLLIMLCFGQLPPHTPTYTHMHRHFHLYITFFDCVSLWNFCVSECISVFMSLYAFSLALLPFFFLFVCCIHIVVLFYVLFLLFVDVSSFPKEKE